MVTTWAIALCFRVTTGIPACLRCGSRDLRMPGSGDGVVVGVGLELNECVCNACGWKGIPVFFEDAAAYRSFLSTLEQAGT